MIHFQQVQGTRLSYLVCQYQKKFKGNTYKKLYRVERFKNTILEYIFFGNLAKKLFHFFVYIFLQKMRYIKSKVFFVLVFLSLYFTYNLRKHNFFLPYFLFGVMLIDNIFTIELVYYLNIINTVYLFVYKNSRQLYFLYQYLLKLY